MTSFDKHSERNLICFVPFLLVEDESALKKSEVVNWYLKEIESEIDSEMELINKKTMIEKVIYRLVHYVRKHFHHINLFSFMWINGSLFPPQNKMFKKSSFLTHNSVFISQSSDFITHNYEFISYKSEFVTSISILRQFRKMQHYNSDIFFCMFISRIYSEFFSELWDINVEMRVIKS